MTIRLEITGENPQEFAGALQGYFGIMAMLSRGPQQAHSTPAEQPVEAPPQPAPEPKKRRSAKANEPVAEPITVATAEVVATGEPIVVEEVTAPVPDMPAATVDECRTVGKELIKRPYGEPVLFAALSLLGVRSMGACDAAQLGALKYHLDQAAKEDDLKAFALKLAGTKADVFKSVVEMIATSEKAAAEKAKT